MQGFVNKATKGVEFIDITPVAAEIIEPDEPAILVTTNTANHIASIESNNTIITTTEEIMTQPTSQVTLDELDLIPAKDPSKHKHDETIAVPLTDPIIIDQDDINTPLASPISALTAAAMANAMDTAISNALTNAAPPHDSDTDDDSSMHSMDDGAKNNVLLKGNLFLIFVFIIFIPKS